MRKSIFILIIIFVLLTSSVIATDHYVTTTGNDTSGNGTQVAPWLTIQHAIDNVTAGDIIYVANGTYTENVEVNKAVNLIGDGYQNTTVSAANSNDHVFEVTVNNVNISGFTLTGATNGTAGVRFYNADYFNFSNNNASDNRQGMSIFSCSFITITNNIINSNDYYGFYIGASNNMTIENNTINSNFYDGFYIGASNNITIENNNINLNGRRGIFIEDSSSFITIANNTINSNKFGVLIEFSTNNFLINNTINSNNVGFYLDVNNGYEEEESIVLAPTNHSVLNNILSNNFNSVFDNDNTTVYLNNKFNSDNNIVFEPSVNRSMNVGEMINFDVYVNYINQTPCSSVTVNNITTEPSENVSYNITGNKVSINFTPSRQGLYSFVLNITNDLNNTYTQRFYFGNQSMVNYYFSGNVPPTHGQPAGADAGTLIFEAPINESTIFCGRWIQASTDNISNSITGISRIININMSFWYKNGIAEGEGSDGTGAFGIQRNIDFDEFVEYGKPLTNSENYTWFNGELDASWWIYNRTNWYLATVKILGLNPFWLTNATDPSYVNISYLYTTTPEIKNISNSNINILSATTHANNTNNAEIKLEGVNSTDLVVQMPNTFISNYTASFDNVSCNSSNCNFTQSNGLLEFNLSLTSEHNLTIEGNTIPNIPTLNSPDNNSVFSLNYVLLNISVSDPNNDSLTVWFYGDGTLINTNYNVLNGTSTTYNWTSLGNGNHNLSIIVGDGIENNSSLNTYFFAIAVEAPTADTAGTSYWETIITKHTETEIEQNWKNIYENETYEWEIDDFTVIDTIRFTSNKRTSYSKINIHLLNENPTGIKELENTYQYLNLTQINMEVKQANITFKVNKSWAKNKTIILSRYNNEKWNDLDTKYLETIGDYNYYTATTPGFSYFAIITEENKQEIIEETIELIKEQEKPIEDVVEKAGKINEIEEGTKETKKKTNRLLYIIIILAIGIIIYLINHYQKE
jgi:PGF-pre-PGF domain-containing protein